MKKGFTLAEVLITLVIIGVIAAITIPTLMNKTNEQETVVAVKKAFSVISQAYQRIVAESGELNPSMLGDDNPQEKLGNIFAKQLNAQKVCGADSSGDCFPDVIYKFFNGEDCVNFESEDNGHYKIRLSDGMSIAICWFGGYVNYGDSEALQSVFGDINVDINGDKGPNVLGKDLFNFLITKYGIIPSGTADNTQNPFSSCRTLGYGCTAWVLSKGNVDYWNKEVSW